MFGIFYAAVIAIATTVSGTKCAIEEHKQISKAKKLRKEGKNKYNLYTDRQGATRDLTTGQLRRMDYIGCEDEGDDQFIRDIYGNPIRNLSSERRWERVAEAREDPRRTVSLWKKGVVHHKVGREGNPPWEGDQYRDLENGKIYVCRHLSFPKEISYNYGGGIFYMDTETGYLVREADCQIYDRKRGVYKYSEAINSAFIDYFNKKQKAEGYYSGAKEKTLSGWEQKENALFKQLRLDSFYCNKDSCSDEPRRELK